MRNTVKLGLITLIAALLLASALSTASARNFEINTQNIRATWSRLEFVSPLVTVRCIFTLEGSFHSRTIPKVARLLIGAITRVDIKNESCTNGTYSVDLRRGPWHLTYDSFAGTLPLRISSVRFLLERFLYTLTTLGLNCRYGRSTDNMRFDAFLNEELLVTTLQPVEGSNVANLLEGRTTFPECPSNLRLVGSTLDGKTRVLNTNAEIKIRLI